MALRIKKFGSKEHVEHSIDAPSPAILAGGINGVRHGQYQLTAVDPPGDSLPPGISIEEGKPPYRVPSMEEIRALLWNGLKVASTFAGCGGSSTGYRMAGYRVVWANEFVPIAQESYRANMAPYTILDGRDVRQVQAREILEATGMKEGELDIFDGSPPCQAFSSAGARERGWGKDKVYEHGAKQRNEELFFDYIRLLDGLKPRAFVAENVSGLVRGTAKGYFLDILAALKRCGYRVEARELDAQWLGVPQSRHRIIFIGVREDLNLAPVFPKPLRYRYSTREALPWIGRAVHDTSGQFSLGEFTDKPSPAILTGASHYHVLDGAGEGQRRRRFEICEARRLCGFPDDFILKGSYSQQWERLGNSVPPVMMSRIAATLRDQVLLQSK